MSAVYSRWEKVPENASDRVAVTDQNQFDRRIWNWEAV